LTEVGVQDGHWENRTVSGIILEVELTSGQTVSVWRAENGQDYFCHGLTFGGKEAPGGVVSPLGNDVPTILRGHYDLIPEGQARAGDILVWRGASANDVIHSAILTNPVLTTGKNYLDYATRLQTKNGITPETNMSLEDLIVEPIGYGESYNAYRRR
jgi:hypothetical protein